MVFYTLILLVFSNNGVGMHLVGSFRKHFLSYDDLPASSSAYHDSHMAGRNHTIIAVVTEVMVIVHLYI